MAAAEVLEDRLLLTTNFGTHDIEVVGRTAAGGWWASGFDYGVGSTPNRFENEVFATWDPGVDWQHVRFGDFDGDGLEDIAGYNPETGIWHTTLSDMVGSTTVPGGRWSTATTWSDVGVVDLAAPGDRGEQGHFVKKADLVGRTAGGAWWAAVSNGDGTYTNVFLGGWSPSAGWQDVQFLDINSDGATDIVARNANGGWWGLVSRGSLIAYDTVRLAGWSVTAGWQDVLVVENFFREGDPAILGRSSDGGWWALDFAADGTATTRLVTGWAPGAGWEDVFAADLDGDGRDEVIGRTSAGGWWQLSPLTMSTSGIGGWSPAANWVDVQVARDVPHDREFSSNWPDRFSAVISTRDAIIGRASDGAWWASKLEGSTLQHVAMGHWDPAAGWQDVTAARVTRPPVFARLSLPTEPRHFEGSVVIDILGHRSGTEVYAFLSSTSTADGKAGGGKIPQVFAAVSYHVPATGYAFSFRDQYLGQFPSGPIEVRFAGHYGRDSFQNFLAPSIARGNAGDDTLDGRNDRLDHLFGGDGLDVLLGDPGDVLVQ
ncbi:MAG: hypothetical protein H0T47_20670 [Planctomycetaceae bacterium]|nr:hypothetical protein [Planctomycetaceae bacterium]